MGKTDGIILMIDQFESAVFVGINKDFGSRVLFKGNSLSLQSEITASIVHDVIHTGTDRNWKLVLSAIIIGLFGARDDKLEPEDVAQIIVDLFTKIDSKGEITK